MLEPNDNIDKFVGSCDTEEEEDEDQASEEIPQSLLSYFDISQSRAAVCERLLLNVSEACHHTEGQAMNNLNNLDEQNQNEENLNDDTFLNKDPNTEDDAVDQSLKEKYIHDGVECKTNQEEKQREQREIHFQQDLQKITTAEKFHQEQLELNKRKDHEKLQHELQLQQEHISNLQKQVEDMKKMIQVEQRRQQKEDERKRVEREERKRRKEEEKRRQERSFMKEEERRKTIERKLKEEERRKEEEEEMRKKEEEEEKRKREEENRWREERVKEELKRKKDEELKEEEKKRLAEEIKRKKKESKENREEVKSVKEDDYSVIMNYRQIKKHKEEEKATQETDVKHLKDEEGNEEEEEEERRITDESMMEVTGSEMSGKELTLSDVMSTLKHSEEDEQKMNDEDENGSEEVTTYVDKSEKNCGKMEKREENMTSEVMRKEGKVENEMKGVGDGDQTHQNVSDKTKSDQTKEIQTDERWTEEGKTQGHKEKMRKEVKNDSELMDELINGRIMDTAEQERHSGEEDIQPDTNTRDKESTEGLKVTASDAFNLTSCSSISHPLTANISPTSGDQSHLQSTEVLPDHTEQKRLLWMKECIPWSKTSFQNLRKREGSAWSGTERTRRRVKDHLPPLSPSTLLHCMDCTSLEQVTMVTLEDLDGCSLSTVALCPLLRSLTLRRCGLRALEGISKLQKLLYVDVQENDISYVDCENMTNLRVLRLSHNKLTSIHGLRGVDSLDFLDISHNSIIRIAGLEFTRRLQRLLVDHNQLISTKGLRDVSTLLHLDLSHNHLSSVEGLENSALLHSLDLRANSLTEIPILNNQVLLRELNVDDNNISSLQRLSACWLPLMHQLSVAQNRITELPSMWDFVSLQNLDLRFNLLSELKDVCRHLEGCTFLHVVHLVGNPLQQESEWRSCLQTAVSGLKAIDGQQTDSFQQVNSSPGLFQTFCQAQLKQTRDLEQRHSVKLNVASPTYGAIKDMCQHFNLTLKLAENQRYAHEYGDTTVSKRWEADLTAKENTLNCTKEENFICHTEETTSSNELPVILREDDVGRNSEIFKEVAPAERDFGTDHSVKEDPKVHISTVNGRTSSFPPQRTSVDLKSTAAAVIQHRWRKYKEKCRNVNALVIVKKEGERGECEGKPESEPSCMNKHALNQDSAACAIQAFWRGFALRRRLTSALAAVTCPDAAEDDTLEEVDLDEFVFDEEFFTFPEDFLHDSAESEQLLHLQPTRPCLDLYQSKPAASSPQQPAKQAWVTPQHSAPPDRTTSSSTSAPEGLSNRTESLQEEWGLSDGNTALLMLKRAQNMKSKKQLPRKHQGQPVTQASLRNFTYLLGSSETRQRPAPRRRSFIRVGGATLGLQQVNGTDQTKQEPTRRWIHAQAARSDKLPESERFLPDIHSPSVQLAGQADPTYADHQHHSSGFWALSSLPAQLGQINSHPRGNSMDHSSLGAPTCSSDRERPTRYPHSESPSATPFLPDVPEDRPSRVRRPSQTCLRRITF